jgi:putative intracellular protease/amidase
MVGLRAHGFLRARHQLAEQLGSRLCGQGEILENAGGIWVNEPVVADGNLISSRTPKDYAPFAAAMVNFLDTSFRR